MIINLDKSNYFQNISTGLKLVEFYADWCGYCARQADILKNMEITVYAVNSDTSPEIVHKYGITSYPSFVLFRDGKEITRFSGLRDKFEIMDILTKFIKK